MQNIKIDFVVPWVDSSDPDWQVDFKKHKDEAGIYSDISDKRYRDWELFKYWFRGVEKYAPWVNKIHLITCGHSPNWLNFNHPKLNLIKHEDYINKQYLPIFSSHPIELNIHRINGLSEHFVYFNDDMFVKAPMSPCLFFKNGIPCDSGVMTALSGSGINRIVMNSTCIVNKHFNKRKTMKDKPLKWFNLKYSYELLRTICLLPWEGFTGFYDYHLPNAFLKSTLQEVWEKEYELVNNTTMRKFRNDLDISQYIFRYWQLAQNNFHPINKHSIGDMYRIGVADLDLVIAEIISSKKPIICLNDHDPENLDETIERLKQAFEEKFPNKGSFEL